MPDNENLEVVGDEPQYEYVTSSIITDDTGQAINTTLQSLVGAISGNEKMYCGQFVYDSTNSRFPLGGNPRPKKINNSTEYPQLTLLARNRNTGAIYALWYNNSVEAFLIAATISGSAPSNGNKIELQYFAE